MPQETLEYSSTVSTAWASDIAKVEDDDGVFAVADTLNQMATIQLGDLTNNDIGSVNSITIYASALIFPAKRVARLAVYIQNSSGTTLTQGVMDVNSSTEALFNTGALTFSGISESSINDMQILLRYLADSDPGGTTDLSVDYLYAVVDYDIPVPPPYNNNRNRLHIANGRIDLTSGRLSI